MEKKKNTKTKIFRNYGNKKKYSTKKNMKFKFSAK